MSETAERHSLFDTDNALNDPMVYENAVHLHSVHPKWERETVSEISQIKLYADDLYQMREHESCKDCGIFCISKFLMKRFKETLFRGDILKAGKGEEFTLEGDEEVFHRCMRNGAYRAWSFHMDNLTDGKLRACFKGA